MPGFFKRGTNADCRARHVKKVVQAVALSMGIAAGALATASSAWASGTNYTWAGSDLSSSNWQQPDNWLGNASPSGTIGTLSFPDLGAACDNGTSSGTCYTSGDQLGNITATQLSIDDDQAYSLSTSNSSTLTLSGGLSAAPTEGVSTDSTTGDPNLNVPVALSANQTWSIDGGTAGNDYGIQVPVVPFSSPELTVNFTNGGTLTSTSLDPQFLVANGDGTIVAKDLLPGVVYIQWPSQSITLENGASFDVGESFPSGTLSVTGGSQTAKSTVAIGDGAAPDVTLTPGGFSLDPWTNLYLDLDNNDTTAGNGGYSAVHTEASGLFDGATLYLDQGRADQSGDCTTLSPGDSFVVISTDGVSELSGDLTYFDTSGNFDTLGEGQTSQPVLVSLPTGCSTGMPGSAAVATLTYGPYTITATIVAAPVESAAPAITGTPQVGQTLSMTSSGTWTAYPAPAYTYQWESCSGSSCTPIVYATASTFTLTSAQAGEQIKLRVTATNSVGSTSADSNSLGPVTNAEEVSGAPPVISGTPMVGNTLTTTSGDWIGSPSLTYSWQSCPTSAIPCTTFTADDSTSYTLTASDVGHYLHVMVCLGGSQIGCESSSRVGPVLASPQELAAALKLPTGRHAAALLLKHGSFMGLFTAPTAGSLRVILTTRVTSGKGKHRTTRTVWLGTAAILARTSGPMHLTFYLSAAGRALLKKRLSGLTVVATEKFRQTGADWTVVTHRFSL